MILELVGITKVFTEFILNYTKTNSTITKILHCLDVAFFTLNPFALRMAKTLLYGVLAVLSAISLKTFCEKRLHILSFWSFILYSCTS